MLQGKNQGFYGYVWSGAQYEGLINAFMEFAGSEGGFVKTDKGFTLNTPANVRALKYMRDLMLNLVAGLERPSEGVIRFGDRVVADPKNRIFLPPRDRDVAMVFQSYALYPHMNVFNNIAFPLKIAKEKKETIKEKVEKTADLLGIKPLLERKPGELSGGQRQRVSMGRALVRDPKVFLLDEPLSNLDAQLRTSTRGELKRLQRDMGITTLYVTHDQVEAMTLGDRIALFNKGKLVQMGSPEEMYERPENPFTATFVGSPPMNLMEAAIIQRENGNVVVHYEKARMTVPESKQDMLDRIPGKKAQLGIRPENIRMSGKGEKDTLSGTVHTIEPLGREILYHVQTENALVVAVSQEKDFETDQRVYLHFDPENIHLFNPDLPEHKQGETRIKV